LKDSEVDSTVYQDTIDVGLVFEKDTTGKQECIAYVDSDYVGDL